MRGEPSYVRRGAGLPDMGVGGLGPRGIEPVDIDRIMDCNDAAALSELKAYARSYFAVSGLVVAGVTGALVASVAGRRGLAVGAALAAGGAALAVMEARRRARQWEAAADARLTVLGAR